MGSGVVRQYKRRRFEYVEKREIHRESPWTGDICLSQESRLLESRTLPKGAIYNSSYPMAHYSAIQCNLLKFYETTIMLGATLYKVMIGCLVVAPAISAVVQDTSLEARAAGANRLVFSHFMVRQLHGTVLGFQIRI